MSKIVVVAELIKSGDGVQSTHEFATAETCYAWATKTFDLSQTELQTLQRRGFVELNLEVDGADLLGVGTVRKEVLPPDPDGINDERSGAAQLALAAYMSQMGADEVSLTDLLASLMHWADRHDEEFLDALALAYEHYKAETEPEEGSD